MHCSFCGRERHEVQKLVAGPGVFICNECVDLSVGIIAGAADTGSEEPEDDALAFWRGLDDDQLLEHLPRTETVRTHVDDHLRDLVAEARQRGLSWDRIGGALGMRRQSAWERFGAS